MFVFGSVRIELITDFLGDAASDIYVGIQENLIEYWKILLLYKNVQCRTVVPNLFLVASEPRFKLHSAT